MTTYCLHTHSISWGQAHFYCAMYISTDSVTSRSNLLQPPGDCDFWLGVFKKLSQQNLFIVTFNEPD